MENAIKYTPTNNVQLTGRIVRKEFRGDSMNLFLVVSITMPRLTRTLAEGEDAFYREYPGVNVYGEKAVAYNKSLKVGDRVSVVGFLNTSQEMRYVGHMLYRRQNETTITAEQIIQNPASPNTNSVMLAGEITRVYSNKERQFHIITIRIPVDDQVWREVSFTCFDRGMRLKPLKGDVVYFVGRVSTRRQQSPEGMNLREITVTTVVASSVNIIPSHAEEISAMSPEEESALDAIQVPDMMPEENSAPEEENPFREEEEEEGNAAGSEPVEEGIIDPVDEDAADEPDDPGEEGDEVSSDEPGEPFVYEDNLFL